MQAPLPVDKRAHNEMGQAISDPRTPSRQLDPLIAFLAFLAFSLARLLLPKEILGEARPVINVTSQLYS